MKDLVPARSHVSDAAPLAVQAHELDFEQIYTRHFHDVSRWARALGGLSADHLEHVSDEQAHAIGQGFLWNARHRMRGPLEHIDPPGYQSRVASVMSQRRAGGPGQRMTYEGLQEVGAIVVGSPDTVRAGLTELLERTGAKMEVRNRAAPAAGAIVWARWPRRAIEAQPL